MTKPTFTFRPPINAAPPPLQQQQPPAAGAAGGGPASRLRRMGVRGQLMLFLLLICFLILGMIWVLSILLLEPMYSSYIEKRMIREVNTIVSQIDSYAAAGTPISSREMGVLTTSEDFNEWLSDEMYNRSGLSTFCLDIADSTMRSVFNPERLTPCLLHGSTLPDGGYHESSTIAQMRRTCAEEGEVFTTLHNPGVTDQLLVGKTTADGAYTVLLVTSMVHIADAVTVLGQTLPWVAAVVFTVALAAAWLFSQWFTRPLRSLSGAAREVARGNYDITVDCSRSDELGVLARDFNHMAQEVKHSAQMQQELLANVSHDLRTPLTLIKGYAETLRDITGNDSARRDEQLNIIIDEADRLSALVNSVMELAKVSSGAEKCEAILFDLRQLCEEVAERYEAVCEQNGWTLRLDLPPGDGELLAQADPAMMERAMHNLLGNAMHHIGPDGVFILRVRATTEGYRVEIRDHGAGISAADLPYIFDRYYRSRSDAGKVGTGLGLSITKAIFQQHGFRFGVESTPGRGTTFWFLVKEPNEPAEQP